MLFNVKGENYKVYTIACATGENGLVDLSAMNFDSKESVRDYLNTNGLKQMAGVAVVSKTVTNPARTLDIPDDIARDLISRYEIDSSDVNIGETVTRERDPEKIADRVKIAFDNGDIVKGRKGGLKYKSTGKALTASEIKYFSERFGEIDKDSVPDEFTVESK